ncbi:MAG: DNA helicase UvrD [Candidatus Doudnabacteria bacterium]|nr:DNA helicase UvrD [Candidatus Doudnabacteria bacterium]
MRIIADLQIHSKYSRACSQDLNPQSIAEWADKKGIQVVGTGDFTHPKWLLELKESLEELRPGIYGLRDKTSTANFMITGEVSSIYKQGDRVRRVHNMVLVPSFEAADKIIAGLEQAGANLKADGRPIMGVKCPDLVKIVKTASADAEIIPAHAWTPHFGVFGSLSGFDSIEEAFGEQAKHIFAIETGLSSDPKMNWQISGLDKYSLVSNSDAHSLRKIGREANVFETIPDKLSYSEIIRIIREKNPKEFLFTLEFFPEEGKYHLDGHADCKFSCLPTQTKKLGGICPVCGKKLLVGVLNRVGELADREHGFTPPSSIPFKSVIPLEEIIAETLDVGVSSKKVVEMYEKMVAKFPEFEILLDLAEGQVSEISTAAIGQAVSRVREGKVKLEGGYDGVFGKINIFSQEEREKLLKKPKQVRLF